MKKIVKTKVKKEKTQTKYSKQYRELFKPTYTQPYNALPENQSLEQPSIYKPVQSIAIFGSSEEAIIF
jgi:hypothetical protein